MKRRPIAFALILVLLTAALCTAGCTTPSSPSPSPIPSFTPKNTPGYANYTNSTAGFAIQYPRSWNVTDVNNSTTFNLPGQPVTFAVLQPQNASGLGLTLDAYVQGVLSDLTQSVNASNFTLHNSTSSTLAGYPAQTLVFTVAETNGAATESTLYLALINDVGYGLLYSAPQSTYPAYTSVAANMTASFYPTR